MVLSHLHLSNYKQYRHLELTFKEGLVGVIGKNGAGKSTIFEAILYCLFGRDEGNKAHIRSSFAEDPKASVSLEMGFFIGETHFLVKREFRGKALAVSAELYKNDQLVAKGVSPVNEELAKILHMERDAFKRSVFSGQKELSELSDTSGEARKRMIRKMLGLDTLDDAQAKVGVDIRDLNSQIVGQRQNLLTDEGAKALEIEAAEVDKVLKSQRGQLKTETDKLEKTSAEYQAKKLVFETEAHRLNQHHGLERALTQARERAKGLSEHLSALDHKLSELTAQQVRLKEEAPAFANFEKDKKLATQMELERQKQLNKDTVSARIENHQQQIAALQLQLSTLDEALVNKLQTEAALLAKQEAIVVAETEIEQKRNELRELDKQIGGLNSRIREREEKLANLRAIGKEGACPTCLQPLLEGYERVLTELDSQIKALQTNELQSLELQKRQITALGLQLKDQQSSLRSEADKLLVAQSRLQELARQQAVESANLHRMLGNITRDELILREIGTVQFDETAYQNLKAQVLAQEPRFLEFQKAENYLARELPATEMAVKTTQTGLMEARQVEQSQSAELKKLGFLEAAYLKAKADFSGFDAALAQQSAVVRQLEKDALEKENTIARAQEKLQANEAIKVQVSDKLAEIELLRKLSEHLGNFKTEILEKVSPGISREASELFSRITKGKYERIWVDENFDFSIADGGQFYPMERFSGGEVDLANFCLRIAVTKAIMDLSGSDHRLEFLAFDEIFGSQDEERRLEMMLALNYLQEQFRQIYIVSHIESLRDYFPHLLEVQFAAEGSTAIWR